MTHSKIIVALDFFDENSVLRFIEPLRPEYCRLKVGKELFTSLGPDIVKKLVARGFDVFLDLKFHDIPNTVAKACRVAADLGVWMLNVHAMGGQRMLAAAKEALVPLQNPPKLIAVTVLTSFTQDELQTIGVQGSVEEAVKHYATMANKQGLDGVVCSAWEASEMRNRFGSSFLLVTPGIRLADDASGDQRRIMTPVEAINAGASFLVMGRSITNTDNPLSKLMTINSDIYAL